MVNIGSNTFGSYNYFLVNKVNRFNFVCNLLSAYNNKVKHMNFLSIACGTAGEESWLVDKFNKVVLVDKEKQKIQEFYEKHDVQGDYEFIQSEFQKCEFDNKFDVIYTCSPNDWCDIPGWKIPEYYLSFLEKNLTTNGIFIARLYGGKNQFNKNGDYEESFVQNLKDDFKKHNFKVNGFFHHNKKYYDDLNKSNDLWEENPGYGRHHTGLLVCSRMYHPSKDFYGNNITFFDYDSFEKYYHYPIQLTPKHRIGSFDIDEAEAIIQNMKLQLQDMEI